MSTSTPRAGLAKADPTDFVDVVAHIDNGFDKIDTLLGTFVCTSSTRPGSPFTGQTIFETDSGYIRVYDGARWAIVRGDTKIADVVTSQTTASATYVDLATVGPAITLLKLEVGDLVELQYSATTSVSATTGGARISYGTTGAVTVAANDTEQAITQNIDPHTLMQISIFPVTVAGDHTFTLKYRTGGGLTGTYSARRLIGTIKR